MREEKEGERLGRTVGDGEEEEEDERKCSFRTVLKGSSCFTSILISLNFIVFNKI